MTGISIEGRDSDDSLQLLVAEVQSTEGMIQLHTRSLKYGKVGSNQIPSRPVLIEVSLAAQRPTRDSASIAHSSSEIPLLYITATVRTAGRRRHSRRQRVHLGLPGFGGQDDRGECELGRV